MKEITDFVRDLDATKDDFIADYGGKTIILFGEEWQLIEETREIIRQKIKSSEREHCDMDKLPDSPMLETSGGALFGGGPCLYETTGYGKPSSASLESLKIKASRLTAPDIFCISFYGITRKNYKDVWLRETSALGFAVAATPLTIALTASWCRRWLKNWELSLDDDSVLELATQTEGNLSAAKQCLYKIRLSDTPNISDSEKITAALSGGARYNISHLTEAALSGDGKKSLAILNVLLDIQEPPPLIVWAVGNAVSGLLATKRGGAPGWGLPNRIVREVATRTDESRILEVLKRVAYADKVIKGIARDDIRIALTDAVAGLACLRRGNRISTPKLQVS
ncbi:MAG: DNA polymerase III subunit delta [Gammaproteobacteria bacterium WSBS_2016_MAG_OTU1]